jgi:hypothetical protein
MYNDKKEALSSHKTCENKLKIDINLDEGAYSIGITDK